MNPIFPAPDNAPELPKAKPEKLKNGEWVRYPLQYVWPYHAADGKINFYVCRYEADGKKQTPPLSCWDTDKGLKWRFKGLPEIRPIYNLHRITQNVSAQIIIVEGEKCAETLQATIDGAGAGADIIATCWVGGEKGAPKADFSPLKNRFIVMWPDHDTAGTTCMEYIGGVLSGLECKTKYITVPSDKPHKWDVADAILEDGWSFEAILEFIKIYSAAREFAPVQPDSPKTPSVPVQPPARSHSPYLCLGYNHGYYYYLPNCTRQITPIPGAAHTKNALLQLAPNSHWERDFSGPQGPQWFLAANALMRSCEASGIFDPLRLRGRGAWYDNGKSILHLGNRLLIDGEQANIQDAKSKYLYEAGIPLDSDNDALLTTTDARKLLDVTNMLFLDRPIYKAYLAGWCAIAPICGGLLHRPHLWITGGAGSGKSHIFENIILKILGNFSFPFQSSTTSAAIRQTVGSDALPVVIDEFEAEDHTGNKRIQDILELARQAFSDNSAPIAKGGQNGKPTSYFVRSCFLMSSIGVNLTQRADISRIMVLSLEKPHDTETQTKEEHFRALKKLTAETITKKWAAQFRARAIKMIPIIRQNAEIFSEIVATKVSDQRAGDMVGTLIAGAYSLTSDNLITRERAAKWVEEHDFDEQLPSVESNDERQVLNIIVCSQIKVKTANGIEEISVDELIRKSKDMVAVDNGYGGTDYKEPPERDILKRHGLRVDQDNGCIYIGRNFPPLRRILANTPWEKTYGRLLMRLPGAEARENMRFVGPPTRAVMLPWGLLDGSM